MKRAKASLDAGADGVMIHSKEKKPDEILEFIAEYNKFRGNYPGRGHLVVVPTTYNSITEAELQKAGANVVIHANQLLRAAFPAMKKTAESILTNGRSKEADTASEREGDLGSHRRQHRPELKSNLPLVRHTSMASSVARHAHCNTYFFTSLYKCTTSCIYKWDYWCIVHGVYIAVFQMNLYADASSAVSLRSRRTLE